jgi:translation initiation factor IF-1
MEATKRAYMLDEIEVRDFDAADDLTAQDIEANRTTIENLRIWNTSVLPRTYQNFQELEPYYALSKVDTDRYLAEGTPNQVMVAVRELDEVELPVTDWQNQHLFYTHGYGAVVNQANVVQSDGQPVFLLKDVPPVASVATLELEEPRIYFGETYEPGRPVIVRTGSEPQEIDVPLPTGTGFNEYEGDAGVVLDNFFKRIAFAFRYRDLNLLISNQIRPDSRVLVERNVMEIVHELAPFLSADADPYPVIIDGQVLWVLDLTPPPPPTRIRNPSTWRLAIASPLNSGLELGTNYLRNSVKAVIDASNGDVTFYMHDPEDPILRAWADIHPDLFVDAPAMPEGIEDHLRYPQDLFRAERGLPRVPRDRGEPAFSRDDAWSFPGYPSEPTRTGNDRLWGDFRSQDGTLLLQILPYYLLNELPGEEDLSYLLLQPFNPRARQNMVGFLVADSTPGRYGRLIDFRMPQGELVDGAEQAGQRIEQDADIAQQLSLWRGEGSNVIKGDLLIVPIEDSILYLQPIFLEEEGGSFPEFRRVAVVYSDRVEWADTLEGALGLVFGTDDGQIDGDGDGGGVPPPEPGLDLEALIADAEDAFANADAALRAGDLAAYQQWVEEAQRILAEIADLVGSQSPTRRRSGRSGTSPFDALGGGSWPKTPTNTSGCGNRHQDAPRLDLRGEAGQRFQLLAKPSGRMRRGRGIRVLPGDQVDVEVSTYDPTRGRIVWRYR